MNKMKSAKTLGILILAFLTLPVFISALEIGVGYRMGNLLFNQNRQVGDTTFTGDDIMNWGISVNLNQKISDNVYIESAYLNDPILRNITYLLFSYTDSMFSVGLGPFFGVLNSGVDPIFKPGITILARFEMPGIVFLDFRTDNTQSYRSTSMLDYMQERLMLSFGFYVMNAICTINYTNKKFTQSQGTSEIIDMLTEYAFKTLLFQKNVDYQIEISLGYQMLQKAYTSTAPETVHTLNSVVVGFKLEVNITEFLQYTLEMENSIYTFGQGQLSGVFNPGPGGYSFRAFTGLLFNFDKLLEPVRTD